MQIPKYQITVRYITSALPPLGTELRFNVQKNLTILQTLYLTKREYF